MSKEHLKIDIEYIEQLARIALTQEERTRYTTQIGDLLEHFETIGRVDVSEIEPMEHPMQLTNIWAEDISGPCLSVEDALLNAPMAFENQFVVPKIVE